MPRKPNIGPGPKSKTHKNKQKSFLGDSTAEEGTDAESFQSPELEAEQTDYEFNYTTSNNISPRSSISKRTPLSKASATTNEKRSSSGKRLTSTAQNNQASSVPPKSRNKQKPRKQAKPIHREQMIWNEIRELQKRTDNLTPKAPFGRLIREILIHESSFATRITLTALEALQTSSEIYLTNFFADAYVCTLHRGRVTLGVHDVRLVRFLRGTSDVGSRK